MDLKYAEVRSQSLRIAHYSLVHGALYSKICTMACYCISAFLRFLDLLEACSLFSARGENEIKKQQAACCKHACESDDVIQSRQHAQRHVAWLYKLRLT
jgi:hypothetical protein